MPEIKQDLRTATFIVAANNSVHKNMADYVCDGVADQTEINAAIGTGRRVVLLEGTFTIDGTITKAVDNVTLEGQGRGTQIYLANASNCNMIAVGGDGWTIRNLRLDGNKANQTAGDLNGVFSFIKDDGVLENLVIVNTGFTDASAGIILRSGSHNWSILNCSVSGSHGVGIFLSKFDPADDAVYNIRVSHCVVDSCDTPGIMIDRGTYDWEISNCSFHDNGYCNISIGESADCPHGAMANIFSTGSLDGDGIRIRKSSHITLDNYVSYAEAAESGIRLSGSNHIAISNFVIHSSHGGISIDNDGATPSTFVTITNGTIADTIVGDRGIDLISGADITIGNVLITESRTGGALVMHYGIFNRGVDRLTVTDCIFSGMDGYGIYGTFGDDCKYQNNEFKNNPPTTMNTGIYLTDGDDDMLSGNRMIDITFPIDINNANVVRCQIAGNNWEGCTNDVSYAAATTPKFQNNIAKTGGWYATTTKELFIQANSGYIDGGTLESLGNYGIVQLPDALARWFKVTFKVPKDFASFTSCKAVWVCSAAAGNMLLMLLADYGAAGETYNNHSENPGGVLRATAGANIINVSDAGLTLANLTVGDYVGIQVSRGGDNAIDTLNALVSFLGVLFTYIGDDTSTK